MPRYQMSDILGQEHSTAHTQNRWDLNWIGLVLLTFLFQSLSNNMLIIDSLVTGGRRKTKGMELRLYHAQSHTVVPSDAPVTAMPVAVRPEPKTISDEQSSYNGHRGRGDGGLRSFNQKQNRNGSKLSPPTPPVYLQEFRWLLLAQRLNTAIYGN